MNRYEFVRACMDAGISAGDAECEWSVEMESRLSEAYDAWENDPLLPQDWKQEDNQDLWR